MISKETVEKLGTLSRIAIAPDEAERLASDLEHILEYVDSIKKATTGEIATGELPVNRSIVRGDVATTEYGAEKETLLNEAPVREGDYVVVKKIIS